MGAGFWIGCALAGVTLLAAWWGLHRLDQWLQRQDPPTVDDTATVGPSVTVPPVGTALDAAGRAVWRALAPPPPWPGRHDAGRESTPTPGYQARHLAMGVR